MKTTKVLFGILTTTCGLAVCGYSESFLTNGLVAYYPFNGNANDAVGTNNGTVYGASLTPDRFGTANSAYNFNGTSARIVTINPLPDMHSASASCWIRIPALPAGWSYVFMDGDQTAGDDFMVEFGNSNIWFATKDSIYLEGTLPPPTNTWFHVVAAADNDTTNGLKIWLNGQLIATAPSLGNANVGHHSQLCIGCRSIYDDLCFNGAIDDLRFYNRALSASEVQELYAYESSAPATIPPSITSQPQSVTVNAHANASFSVTATGTTPLNYQWSFNGTNILGATSSGLSITNVTPAYLGVYAVVASNSAGSVTSSNAMLFMYPFLASPFGGVVTDWGYTNTLSVGAWGTQPLVYQWLKNGSAIANATNSTLTLTNIQFADAGLYSVVVSNPFGSVTNTPAQVVVNPAGVSLGLYAGVTVSGVVGYTYDIQASSDLSNTNSWTTVATMTLMQPVQLWVDTRISAFTNPHRYYRVVAGE